MFVVLWNLVIILSVSFLNAITNFLQTNEQLSKIVKVYDTKNE